MVLAAGLSGQRQNQQMLAHTYSTMPSMITVSFVANMGCPCRVERQKLAYRFKVPIGVWSNGDLLGFLNPWEGCKTRVYFVVSVGGRVSHNLDVPIAHEYRGHTVFLKFVWKRPNDLVPESATIIEPLQIDGMGEVASELPGPWPDYPAALNEAMSAAERWVDSQLP